MEFSRTHLAQARLRRDLGLLDAVGIGLGAVMGAGIFVVTGVAAGVAGPGFLVGLVVAGIAATLNGMSAAQVAAHLPHAGGTYESGCRLLHPLAGFAAGWMFLTSKLAAAATVALGFGRYVEAVVPGGHAVLLAVAAVGGLTCANLLGVKKAGRLNLLIITSTVGMLGAFVVLGVPAVRAVHFVPLAPHGWHGVAESAALMFFAYTGYARIATLGEEVRDPATTIPRAILLALGLSLTLYLLVGVVAVGSVGAEGLAASRAPLERAAAAFAPAWFGVWLGGAAALAMLGVLLSQILGISRMILAMARRGDLPRVLGAVAARRAIPARGVVATGGMVGALVGLGGIGSLVAAASFTILLYYALTNLAALRLPAEHRRYPRWIAWAGLFGCIVMAASLPRAVILAGLAWLAVGMVFRAVLRRDAAAEDHGRA